MSETTEVTRQADEVEALAAAKGASTREQLLALAKALWEEPVHERRLCAAFLLEARSDLLEPADLALVERFVRESKTWALVDPLAGKVLGAILVRHPAAAPQLDRWATDEDFWVRRAALLAQMWPLRQGADFERFGRYADTMLDERPGSVPPPPALSRQCCGSAGGGAP